MDTLKGMMWGALAGTLAASALALASSRKDVFETISSQTRDWADKARNVKENVYDDIGSLLESRTSRQRKIFFSGTILGLLVGVGSAALLTPKTGKQLRKDLAQSYKGVAHKTQDIVHFINKNGYRKSLRTFSKTLSKRRPTAKTR